jgi:3-dehydroquinate synthase
MAKIKKGEGSMIEWESSGSYPIRFVDDLFDPVNTQLAETLRDITGAEEPRMMLVADANVVQRNQGLGSQIGRYVQQHAIRLVGNPVVIGGGEKLKSDAFHTVLKVASAAVDARIGSGDVMLALGGGSLLDVAGYAAAQVRGGLKLVRAPTTIAAMADSTFATTACIDATNVKDAMCVQCRPAAVLIDPSFAGTVLDGVWRGGVGELVRYAAAKDASLMKRIAKSADALKNRDESEMYDIVRECVLSRAKKGGSGFALWSAMRLEAMSGYKLPHGYAVPIGICIDCGYAVAKGDMKQDDRDFICNALSDSGALDGLYHSKHILTQVENILFGLDAWRLTPSGDGVEIPSGIGKTTIDKQPDREIYRRVIEDIGLNYFE